MKTLFKTLLAITGVLVTLVLALLILILVLDPNDHKERIAGLFNSQTGLEIEFGGDIDLTLYPWLGLSVNDVTVANPPGYGEQALLQADSAQVRVRLMSLLQGPWEIDTVRLHGADINLIVNEQGIGNWQAAAGQLPAGEAETSAEPSGGLPLTNLILGGVDIRDGRIGFEDRSRQRSYEIRNLNASTGELVYGEPISLDMTLDASSSRPELEAATRLNGVIAYNQSGSRYEVSPLDLEMTLSGPDVPDGSADILLSTALDVDLDADTLTLAGLELDGPGLALRAEVEGSDVQTAEPSYRTQFELSGEDLALPFRIAEMEDLAGRIAGLDSRSFDVDAELTMDLARGDVEVPSLSARLLGATIEGELSGAGMTSDSPRLRGRLNAEGPDLPLLLQLAGQLQGGEDSTLGRYGRQLGEAVDDRGFAINTEFDTDWQQGNIELPELSAESLGLQLDGRLTASDIRSDAGTVDGRLSLSGNNLGPVLDALEQPELADTLQALNLEVDISGDQGDLAIAPLRLSATLGGAAVGDSPMEVKVNADSRLDLNRNTLAVERFTLAGAGLDVSGRLEGTNVLAAPEINGRLDVAPFNLRRLLGQLNQEIPELADAGTLEQLALQTRFSAAADRFAAEDLTLTLDETTLSGRMSVQDFQSPDTEFRLDIDRLDADRYLPVSDSSPGAADSQGPAELPVAMLRELALDGELTIGQLTLSGMQFSDFTARARARDGQLDLAPISTDLYQGQYEGEVALDVSGETPQARMQSSLDGVALEPLLLDLADASYLSGSADIQLSLRGEGGDTDALTRNLDGEGNMAITDGVLEGINVGETLAQVETMIRSERLMSLERGERTPFEQFTATLDISEGAVRSDDLLITAPGFRINGDGLLVNLNDNRIDFNLVTTVDRSTAVREEQEYDIGGYSLPINCSGRIDSPGCSPDFEAVVRQALGNVIERRVGDFLERTLGREPRSDGNGNGNGDGDSDAEDEPEDPARRLINRTLDEIFR